MTTTTSPLTPSNLAGRYTARWRRTPRAAAFAVVIVPLGLVGLALLATVLSLGLSLAVLVIGMPIIAASLMLAARFGRATMNLIAWADGSSAGYVPEAPTAGADRGLWARSIRVIRDPRGWRALVHGILLSPVLAIFTMSAAIAWIAIAVGGPTYWAWQRFLPESDGLWGHHVAASAPWIFGGMDAVAVQSVLYAVAGIVALVSLPIVLSGLVAMNGAVARALLGPQVQSEHAAAGAASLVATGSIA